MGRAKPVLASAPMAATLSSPRRAILRGARNAARAERTTSAGWIARSISASPSTCIEVGSGAAATACPAPAVSRDRQRCRTAPR